MGGVEGGVREVRGGGRSVTQAARLTRRPAVAVSVHVVMSSVRGWTVRDRANVMEATYCMGTDLDVCRMFDQYLYKVCQLFHLISRVKSG